MSALVGVEQSNGETGLGFEFGFGPSPQAHFLASYRRVAPPASPFNVQLMSGVITVAPARSKVCVMIGLVHLEQPWRNVEDPGFERWQVPLGLAASQAIPLRRDVALVLFVNPALVYANEKLIPNLDEQDARTAFAFGGSLGATLRLWQAVVRASVEHAFTPDLGSYDRSPFLSLRVGFAL